MSYLKLIEAISKVKSDWSGKREILNFLADTFPTTSLSGRSIFVTIFSEENELRFDEQDLDNDDALVSDYPLTDLNESQINWMISELELNRIEIVNG
ncbi:MAG: hypothetical protein WC055_09995 [Melioribacteraceae bacterium]